eukprot:scaffold61955_cov34-Attheya_sp.AAC.2
MLEELSDEPFLNLRQVCTDSNVTIGDIKRPGKNNDCVRFFLWGKCNTTKCTLEHPQVELDPAYVDSVCTKIDPGIQKMITGKKKCLFFNKRPWSE